MTHAPTPAPLYREHKQRLEDLYALRRRVNDEIAAEKRAIAAAFPATVKTSRRPTAKCGTDGGYFHHLRVTRDRPCIPCKRAHATVERERTARVRKTQAEVDAEIGAEHEEQGAG